MGDEKRRFASGEIIPVDRVLDGLMAIWNYHFVDADEEAQDNQRHRYDVMLATMLTAGFTVIETDSNVRLC